MPWIRFDTAVMFDDFIFEMTGDEYKAWSFLLLYCKASGARGSAAMISDERLASMANVPARAVGSMYEKAGDRFKVENGRIYVKNWHRYQEDHRDRTASPDIPSEAINGLTPHYNNTTPQPQVQAVRVSDFETIWKLYPNRQDRKNALRHFTATVKTAEDLAHIRRALDNYLRSGNVSRGYIKNGATWFNQWQDWVDPAPAMMQGNVDRKGETVLPSAPRQQPAKPLSEITISCSMCGKDHKASEVCK